jgi:hypothetical protein
MSPKEQKITPDRPAIACALSIISSDLTQTGQPGPCTSSSSSGQQTIDTVFGDAASLAAADFHQHPWLRYNLANLINELRPRVLRRDIRRGISSTFLR